MALLSSSPTYRSLEQRKAAAEAFIHAAWEQDPWTLRSAVTHGQPFPRVGETFVPRLGMAVPTSRSFDVGVTGAMEYRLRSRLVGSVAGAVGYVDDRERPGHLANDLPFSVDLTVGYDVIRGGSESSENDRARANALLGVADKLEAEQAALQAKLGFLEQVVALFGNRCKRQRVEHLEAIVRTALESARIQLDSRVLSQAEYLNYEFLENSIAARRASVDLEQRLVLEGLAAWGPAVAERTRGLATVAVDCDAGRSNLDVWAKSGVLSADEVRQLAERLPGYSARRAAGLSASFDLRASQTELRPGLSPFLAGRFARALGSDEEVVSAQLGLQFDWNIPQNRGPAARDVAHHAHRAAQERVDETYALAVANIRSLTARMEVERNLLEVLKRTAASTGELARVLEVARAIGEANALNQATALVNAVDLELAMVDSWLRLGLAWHQLQALQLAADEIRELHRLGDADWLE